MEGGRPSSNAAEPSALNRTCYPRLLHPDHVPKFPNDPNQRAGCGYVVGHINSTLSQL